MSGLIFITAVIEDNYVLHVEKIKFAMLYVPNQFDLLILPNMSDIWFAHFRIHPLVNN